MRWRLLVLLAIATAGCTPSNTGSDPAHQSSTSSPSQPVATLERAKSPEELRATLPDVIVTDAGFTGLPPSLAEEISALPQFTAVSPLRGVQVTVDGQSWNLAAVSPSEFAAAVDLGMINGSMSELSERTVLIQADKADDLGVVIGDEMQVENDSGRTQTLTVAGVYSEDTFGTGFIHLATFDVLSDAPTRDLMVFAEVADDVDEADARTTLTATLTQHPDAVAYWLSDFLESYPTD